MEEMGTTIPRFLFAFLVGIKLQSLVIRKQLALSLEQQVLFYHSNLEANGIWHFLIFLIYFMN